MPRESRSQTEIKRKHGQKHKEHIQEQWPSSATKNGRCRKLCAIECGEQDIIQKERTNKKQKETEEW